MQFSFKKSLLEVLQWWLQDGSSLWLWLFLSPVPEDLVQSHPAPTLKHWKQICSAIATHPEPQLKRK